MGAGGWKPTAREESGLESDGRLGFGEREPGDRGDTGCSAHAWTSARGDDAATSTQQRATSPALAPLDDTLASTAVDHVWGTWSVVLSKWPKSRSLCTVLLWRRGCTHLQQVALQPTGQPSWGPEAPAATTQCHVSGPLWPRLASSRRPGAPRRGPWQCRRWPHQLRGPCQQGCVGLYMYRLIVHLHVGAGHQHAIAALDRARLDLTTWWIG